MRTNDGCDVVITGRTSEGISGWLVTGGKKNRRLVGTGWWYVKDTGSCWPDNRYLATRDRYSLDFSTAPPDVLDLFFPAKGDKLMNPQIFFWLAYSVSLIV